MLTIKELAEFTITEQRSLINFLTMLTGDRFVADDLFQETFLELSKIREKFKAGTNFGAWARSVARFQALRYMRTRQKDHLTISPELVEQLADSWEEMPHNEYEDRESALKNCMNELQEHHRAVLSWRYKERQSHKYISKQLDRSVSAVKMLVCRIHKKLRYCIESKIINPDACLNGGASHE